jgi:hypothetical protein
MKLCIVGKSEHNEQSDLQHESFHLYMLTPELEAEYEYSAY